MELNSTLVNSTDERILQNFQDNFCRLIGVCAVCFNSEGRACTVPSGSSSDLTKAEASRVIDALREDAEAGEQE